MRMSELIDRAAQIANIPRGDVRDSVYAFIEAVLEALEEGHEANVLRLGKFLWKPTKAKRFRDPSDGQLYEYPPGHKLSFKPSRQLQTRR